MAARKYNNNPPPHLLPSLELITTMTLLFFLIYPSDVSSLFFNYEGFKKNDPTLRLQGDADYDENGCLTLTKLEKNSIGRVTYSENLHLWDEMTGKVTDFSTHFSFIINTQGKRFHLGDGITFFLAAPDFPLSDKDGAGIGLVSRPQWKDPNYRKQHPFVAVEFDTFPNNDLDPPYDHVGIDINSLSTKYTTEWFNVKDGRRYDAEINYDTSTFNLSVSFTGYKNGSRIEQNFSHMSTWLMFFQSGLSSDFLPQQEFYMMRSILFALGPSVHI